MTRVGGEVNLAEIRVIDMVSYLSEIGFEPVKIKGYDHWYLSPLRQEHTASFKVNQKLNRWYDHGIGKGGNLIDFAIEFYQCTITDVIRMFSSDFSFHQPNQKTFSTAKFQQEDPLHINSVKPITSPALFQYLLHRRIKIEIARRYCSEISFSLGPKSYYAIAFKNDSEGYEIRNAFLKISSSPKDITTIPSGAEKVCVFEGFFDFLSYLSATVFTSQSEPENYVVLNSLSLFQRARNFLEKHEHISLFLDRDQAGAYSGESLPAIPDERLPVFPDERLPVAAGLDH